jgi:hypothetical protein
MIIKSMSRKAPSFGQLIGYMDAGASSRDNNIYYNLYTRQAEHIEDEFLTNSEYLYKRKNGVFLYHEVISITRSQQLTEAEQIQLLRQLVYQYIQARAGENLVYAVLHDDKVDNLHYHLMISSNGVETSKRHRLSKAQFDDVKRNLEIFALECHPELEQKKLISKDKSAPDEDAESLSNKGVELQRRTGKTPQKERVKTHLERIFKAATTREELIELLDSENLKIYKRGKHWGVEDETTNRKHRFATLGVAEQFHALDKKLSAQTTDKGNDKATTQTTDQVSNKNRDAKTDANAENVSTNQNTAGEKEKTGKQQNTDEAATHSADESMDQSSEKQSTSKLDPIAEEIAKREEEMKKRREQKAKQTQQQQKKR